MTRQRQRRNDIEHDNVHRWLVSYADYMTLMFALFVVLYAMAMVNEKPFETITESFGRVFQADNEKTKNRGHGDSVLMVNTSNSNKKIYGDSILDVAGPELLDNKTDLSNVSDSKVGKNLTSIEESLNTALYGLVESGFAQLQIDGDWLEIELNSALLFPSGSSSTTLSAKEVISVIYDVIGTVTNFVRVRGYTDNQVINNEIYSSNWELSVFRATAILRLLENLGLNPARMAIEGYGQYYPSVDNATEQGRAKNRKVVIAISKYGLEKKKVTSRPSIDLNDLEKVTKSNVANQHDNESEAIKVIKLENGGIRITTRNEKGGGVSTSDVTPSINEKKNNDAN